MPLVIRIQRFEEAVLAGDSEKGPASIGAPPARIQIRCAGEEAVRDGRVRVVSAKW